MFCKNCGNQVDDGVKFCNRCGAAMTVAAPAAEPVQAAAQQTVQAAPQGDLEALKASIAEREYVFKGEGYSRSIIGSILGRKITYKLAKDELLINYEMKTDTTIPYTDLKSYRLENKVRVGQIIAVIFILLVGILCLMIEDAFAVGVLVILAAIFYAFISIRGTDFIVETHSGQTFKTKMRRISGKKEADRDAFVRDLNIMLQ